MSSGWMVVLFSAAALGCTDVSAMPEPRDQWQVLRSRRFVVYSELPDRETKQILDRMQNFQSDVFAPGRGLPVPDAGVSTDVFLFRKASSMAEYETFGWDAWYQWTPSTSYLLLHQERWEDSMPVAVAMQCLESLNRAYSRVPPWVGRGLSEFYSTYRRAGGQVVVGEEREDHRRRLRESTLLPWDRVWSINDASPELHGEGLALFCAQSWLLVHYLVVGAGAGEHSVAQFLADLEVGSDPDAAFEKDFGFPHTEIGARMSEYGRRGGYSSLRFAASGSADGGSADGGSADGGSADEGSADEDGPADEDGGHLVPLPYPLALARLGELAGTLNAGSDYGLTKERRAYAGEHFARAQEIEPGLASIERGLGAVALAGDDVDEAVAHLRRAVAADSSDVRAHLLLAEAILRRYQARSISLSPGFTKLPPPDIEEARTNLRAVFFARQELVEAHVLFGTSYLYDPGDVTPGLSSLAPILRMFPGRSDVRQAVVFLSLKQGDLGAALDAALGGNPEDGATSRNVDLVVNEAFRQASDSVPKDPARAKELTTLLRARLDPDALTDSQQAELAEIEAKTSGGSGRP